MVDVNEQEAVTFILHFPYRRYLRDDNAAFGGARNAGGTA
jgi:hypothetical protein